jgi:hypothetical protein
MEPEGTPKMYKAITSGRTRAEVRFLLRKPPNPVASWRPSKVWLGSKQSMPMRSAAGVRRSKSGSTFDFFERNCYVKALIAMNWVHISDYDLDRYYLGMVTAEEELAPLEEHILACPSCSRRAEATQDYVDAMRVALLKSSD